MADGANFLTGQSALIIVEAEPRPGPEPALALHLLTVELTVRGMAQRRRNAILRTVKVKNKFIGCYNKSDKVICTNNLMVSNL